MISMNEIYNVLLLEFPYFKKINEEKRQLLCKRTKHFIEGTDFIPRKGMELTNRMLILISACSQQLTLAFPDHYDYGYFEKIIVYPEKYYSTYTEKYHTGEMNTAGIIVLSWEDFYKGITVDNDARNVGLHEFAHALEFMDIANKDMDEKFAACLDKFTAVADHYLQQQPGIPLFRSYATTNLSEFFAVATEYYFEAPKEFAEREPQLFDILNKAYQQNTAFNAKKYKSEITTNNSILAFGDTNHVVGFIVEVFVYLLVFSYCGFISLKVPMVGLPLLFIAVILINKYGFTDGFTLYHNKVHIYQSYFKRLLKKIFESGKENTMDIDYSDILYISMQEDVEYMKSHSSFLNDKKIKHAYTLCYLKNGKIQYAKEISYVVKYESVFKLLYIEKYVGIRLYGKYKKYKRNHT